MKKNTFKYDPIKPEKQPFWMHSIEKPVKNDFVDALKSLGFILTTATILFLIVKYLLV